MPKLLIMALLNPPQLKLTSFIADKLQPATMGKRLPHTYQGYVTPSRGPDRITEKTGSADLTMWAKLTATCTRKRSFVS